MKGPPHRAGQGPADQLLLEHPLKRLDQAPAALLDQLLVRDPFQKHQKLVPADAGDDVVRTEKPADLLREPGEDRVAEHMAVAVVDLLEIIYIDDEQRGAFSLCLG